MGEESRKMEPQDVALGEEGRVAGHSDGGHDEPDVEGHVALNPQDKMPGRAYGETKRVS